MRERGPRALSRQVAGGPGSLLGGGPGRAQSAHGTPCRGRPWRVGSVCTHIVCESVVRDCDREWERVCVNMKECVTARGV